MSENVEDNEGSLKNMLGTAYDIIIYNPPGLKEPTLALEASREGALGVLDLEHLNVDAIKSSVERFQKEGLPFGIRVDPMGEKLQTFITGELPENLKLLVTTPKETLPDMVRSTIYETAHSMGLKVFQEICTPEESDPSAEAGADAIIARGSEGGGRISTMPLGELIEAVKEGSGELPLIARGATTIEMMKMAPGDDISGLVLDSQLFTLEESGLPDNIRELLSSSGPDSSFCIGESVGRIFRLHASEEIRKELEEMESEMMENGEEPKVVYKTLRSTIRDKLLSSISGDGKVIYPAGEDLSLSKEFEGYGGLQEALSDIFGEPSGSAELTGTIEREKEEREMKEITVEKRPVPADYYDNVIAVIGVGSVFPKGIGTENYWNAIEKGIDACGEVPEDRWDWKHYYDPDRKAPDKSYTKIGAFITDLEMDFREFKMPPKMFEQIDYYQRYVMKATKEALMDAGIFENKEIDRTRVGVILSNSGGGENRDWGSVRVSMDEIYSWMDEVDQWTQLPADARNRIKEDLKKVMDTKIIQINEDSMPGCLPNVASGRIAHMFNFQGPNFITDAACASSLAAVHTARNGLILGQMDIAVSGGTDSVMTPQSFVEFCKIGALTPDGSRPFSDGANGFLMGEGAGVVILKRLDDAVNDGDRIYGLVKGIGASSDGKAKGITAPNPEGQHLSLRAAYEDAGIDPSTISFIEAHGTSTAVGDVAELSTLQKVFGGLPPNSIGLTSIKSQIGHLKAAAGAAGMIKALLAIQKKVMPPQINFSKPNHYFDWDNSPFYVVTEMEEWKRKAPDIPRRCGVSAFGFGGTNFHMVLEEFDPDIYRAWKEAKKKERSSGGEPMEIPPARANVDNKNKKRYLEEHGDIEAEAFLFSSNDPMDLMAQAEDAVESARELVSSGGRLRDAVKFPSYDGRYRLGISAKDPEHLEKQVEMLKKVGMNEKALMALAAKGIFVGDKERMDHGKVCFMFPGQGSQYINMFRELKEKFKIVSDTFEEADTVMEDLIPEPLSRYVFKDLDPRTPEYEEASETLRQTEFNQPSMLTVDTSMYKLLKKLGVEPDLAMGHSLGEYGALIASGVMDFGDALKAVSARGREMRDLKVDDPGKMASVMAGLEQVEEVLDTIDGYVIPANKNCYVQTVIAGETEAVEKALEIFKEKGIDAVQIPVSHAFHSAVVAPVKGILRDYLSKLKIGTPAIPLLSNVTGDYYPKEGSPEEIKESILDLLKEQVASPVEWIKQVKRAYDDGCRTFIEVGPKRALSSFAYNIMEKDVKQGKVFPITSNHPKKGGMVTFNEMVASLWSLGFDLKLPEKDDEDFYNSSFIYAFGGPAEEAKPPASPEPSAEDVGPVETGKGGVSSDFQQFLSENREAIDRFLMEVYDSVPKETAEKEQERMDVDLSGTGATPPSRKGVNVVISGAAFGLPGKFKKVFSEDNLDLLVEGRNLIESIPDRFTEKFLEKNILRLDKKPDGSAELIKLDDASKVARLAGMLGDLDLHEEFGVPENLIESLDITSKLAMASALLALKDAGIPLVRRYSQTSTGSFLPEEWELPIELQEDTGIIFASAFPGYDNLYSDMERFCQSKIDNALIEERKRLFDLIREKAKGTELETGLKEWSERNPMEASEYRFPRNYMFKMLAMGHSQLAQYIKAKGPNIQMNSACASSTIAVGVAQDWIQAGRCKRVIVVGADDPSSEHSMEWLGSSLLSLGALTNEKEVTQAALPFDERRKGMIIGSGSAALIVEAEEEPKRRGMEPLVEVLGSHIGNSAFHGSRLDVAHIARSMERFIYKMEREHGFERKEITSDMLFMSHETYTPARGGSSSAEVESLRRTFGDSFKDIIVLNTKGYTGHAFAACIEDPVLVRCLEKGLQIPIANLTPEHLDEQFRDMQLSRGGTHNRHYGLRLAAGFGSQLAFLLLRRGNYKGRYANKERYDKWLRSIATTEPVELEIENNILRLKDNGRDKLIPHRAVLRESSKICYEKKGQTGIEEDTFRSIKDEVVRVFAAKMGLPVDSIDIDAKLEADLGIDTVKQVELFGAARIHFDLPKDEGVNLRDYPTLRHVIKYIVEKIEAKKSSAKETSKEKEETDLWETVKDKVIETVAEKTGYPADMLEIDLDLESDLGIDTVKQVELFAAAREDFDLPKDDSINLSDFNNLRKIIDYVVEVKGEGTVLSTETEEKKEENEEPQTGDKWEMVKEKVLEIVAEKTGYPADMLEMDLDLEADLGIDTVKQVELFAAAREDFNLPKDDSINLSDFNTLRKIVDYVVGLSGLEDEGVKKENPPEEEQAPPPEESEEKTPAQEPETAAEDGRGHWDMVKDKVIEIVAEKTGYPKDMLEMDLDLEADLGIDTVKQVELFAMAREDFNLPKDDSINLSDFPTMRHLVDYVAGLTEGEKEKVPSEQERRSDDEKPKEDLPEEEQAPPPEESEEKTPAEEPETAAEDSGGHWDMVKEKVIEIVAEKTGYPKDMLEMDLDLEADLGIDTVKQVELFAMAREDFNLPKDDSINLSDFPTMRHLVDYVAGLTEGLNAPPEEEPEVQKTMDMDQLKKRVNRWVLETREMEQLPDPDRSVLEGMKVVVMGGGEEGAQAVQDILKAEVLMASPEEIMDGKPELDGVKGVINLYPFELEETSDPDDWRRAGDLSVKPLFKLTKDLNNVFKEGGFFASIVRMGGRFGLASSTNPFNGAVDGYTKAVVREYGNTNGLVLDVPPEMSIQDALSQLAKEIDAGHELLEVGWDGQSRYRPVLRIIEPPSPKVLDLEDGMKILVSGGGAGITAEIVREMAHKAKLRLHLLGRTPLPEDVERLASLDEEGLKKEKERIKDEIRSSGEKFSLVTLDRRYGRVLKARTTHRLLQDLR
ncbi:MAG: beta-ketoacyl synthase N-terminal-like domain-containing protein, partial [Thermoplasmatota archaeon]